LKSKKQAPQIRTNPYWDDSNFVDYSKLSDKQKSEMQNDPDHEFNTANTYDPNQYDDIIEKFSPTEDAPITDQNLFDIWGNFVPTFYQYEWYEHFTKRGKDGGFERNVEGTCVIHRRGGKSVGVLTTVFVPRCLTDPGLYLHIFPTLVQGRGALWTGMGRVTRDMSIPAIPYMELFPKQYWVKKNNHEMTLELSNGSIYRLGGAKGSDGTANHWRGYNPMGVVPDEYGEWDEDVVSEIFSPVLAQNGGFIFRIGTPKGENQFFRDYMYDLESEDPRNKAWLLDIEHTYYNDGTPIITREYIEQQLARGVDPEVIQQEYYCSFKAAASGSWYKHSMARIDEEERVREVPYNEAHAVDVDWDLGGSDAFVAGIRQSYGDYHRYIDCIKMESVPIGVVMDAVLAKYPKIRSHYFPHDGKMRIDMVDYFQSRIEALRKKGINNIVQVPRSKTVADGIQLTKEYLTQCLFDQEKCQELVSNLRNYKKKFNRVTNSYGDSAVHDKHSHGADMIRTGATAFKLGMFDIDNGFARATGRKRKLSRLAKFNHVVQ
jgi:hypothetical protein